MAALAAAAVLQRVRWDDRPVEVPLARVVRVDPDEVVLKLAGGRWLVLAVPTSGPDFRAALRRWDRETEEGSLLVLIVGTPEVERAIAEAPPERPDRRIRATLMTSGLPLWEDPPNPLAKVLTQAADRRPSPPEDLLDRLRRREGEGPAAPGTPPPTPMFQRLVFALSQAHDLVRLVRGEARLRLRTGSHLTVLAGSGDPDIDHRALAAALARIAGGLADDDTGPGLLVVDGPEDLLERVQQVLGRAARLGRVNTVSQTGVVRPADGELSQLVGLARRWEGPIDLFSELEAGLSRSGGKRFDRDASAAGRSRIGLVRDLLNALPGVQLGWLEGTGAQLRDDARELRVRWVGPEGGAVEDALGRWRLAAVAARWTGHTVDLLLAGGDAATWDRARRGLGGQPEGHVYHLASDGKVRSKAGLLGPVLAPARALRRLARRPEDERQCSLDELERDLDRSHVQAFRTAVADAEFVGRLSAVAPWATRVMIGLIVVVYALQIRWDGTDAMETTGAGSVRMGALTGEGLWWLIPHEPWRLLSAAFLHASWWHIGLNGLALWVLGRRLEALLGPRRFIVLFVVSCLGGSALHELFSAPGDLAVGSSTGIVGLLAAQGALTLFRRDLLPQRIRRLLWREAWINGVIIAVLSMLPFVGGLAHLGGAIAGFAAIAVGLVTWGVTPAEPQDDRPTRAPPDVGWTVAAAVSAAAAIASSVVAIGLGAPWELYGDPGRVRDTELLDGALTLPIQGRPDLGEDGWVRQGNDEVIEVMGGDVLRDGMELRVIARPLNPDNPVDLERVAALSGGEGAETGAITWDLRQIGGAPTVELIAPNDGPFVVKRWLVVRDHVVVDVRLKALRDVDDALLSGTWERIPAGVNATRAGFGGGQRDRMAELDAAERGELASSPDEVLSAINLASRGDLEAARRALDVVIASDEAAWSRAVLLSQVLSGDTATLLSGRAVAHADLADKDALHLLHTHNLMRAGRFELALQQPPVDDLTRASALYYAGRDDEAALAATAWRQNNFPTWADALASLLGSELPPELEGNLAWAAFLEGDAERCVAGSTAALERNGDLAFARYNLALCELSLGNREGAERSVKLAHDQAIALGDHRLRRSAAMDFRGLERRGVGGATELFSEYFDDLND